jgi:predicted metal-dependent HD superfamily phosphohydrolase
MEPPRAGDAELVVDLDLSILAAPREVYDAYEKAVRAEYEWVPEPLFRAGRSKLLKQLLDMPRLYHKTPLAQRWEQPARENLLGALKALA